MILSQVHPAVESIGMFSKNTKDPEKRIVINVDGIRYTLSRNLTNDLRNKRITVNDLWEYEVRDEESKEGESYKGLGYPGEDIIVAVDWKTKAKKSTAITAEELAELVAF